MAKFRKKFVPSPTLSTCAGEGEYEKVVEDGYTRKRVFVSASDYREPLPSPDVFSLDAQLKAGVQLSEVNTKILDASPTDDDVDRVSKFIDEQLKTE